MSFLSFTRQLRCRALSGSEPGYRQAAFMPPAEVDSAYICYRISVIVPAPTVRPPSRIAKRRPFSIATGVISSISSVHVVARHHHLDAFRQLRHARHVRRAEVELRTVAVEERRMTAAFFLRQNVDLALDLGVRRDRARSWPAPCRAPRRPCRCRAAADPRCRPPWPSSSCFLNISTPVTTVLRVSRKPTISTSSPTFTLPRSIRPVTTVPRPEIEKMSSIGIRNGWSMARAGSGT